MDINETIKNLSGQEIIEIFKGRNKNEKLGVNQKHFSKDPSYAKEFFRIASKKIHPDICKINGAEETFMKLKELYDLMSANSRAIDNSLSGLNMSEKVDKVVETIGQMQRSKIEAYILGNKINVKMLKEIAKKLEVNIKGMTRKEEIINAIINR